MRPAHRSGGSLPSRTPAFASKHRYWIHPNVLGVPDDSAGTRSAQTHELSIFLDDAIAACGFQSATHLCRLFRRRKGTDKSPIVDPRSAEIGTANDRLAAAKLAGVFRLQRPKRSLSPAFTALRGNLNRIATA